MHQRHHRMPPQGDDWLEAFIISLLHTYGASSLVTCGRVPRREPRYPATEVPSCHTEEMTG